MAAKNNIVIHEGESREIIIYRDSDNTPKVEVLLQHENLWLTQKSLSTLFGVERSVSSDVSFFGTNETACLLPDGEWEYSRCEVNVIVYK